MNVYATLASTALPPYLFLVLLTEKECENLFRGQRRESCIRLQGALRRKATEGRAKKSLLALRDAFGAASHKAPSKRTVAYY